MSEQPSPEKITALKVPPHSIEAEQAVLGALMLDDSRWDLVSEILLPGDFYRKEHRLIFDAMGKQVGSARPIDVITLSETLLSANLLKDAGGVDYLGELVGSAHSTANIGAYAGIIKERAILRKLISTAHGIADSGYNPDGRDSAELLDAAEQAVFRIADERPHDGGPQALTPVLKSAVERIEKLFHAKGNITGLSTGFKDLDEMTSGLQDSDLVIVAGRPSMGKTSFAMNMVEHAALHNERPVLVFSLEMPADSLIIRMLSSIGRIDQSRMRNGKLDNDDWDKLTAAVAKLRNRPLYIDDTSGLSPSEMRARARRVAREHGQLGLIMVDYLQLMQVKGSSENRTGEISEISRSLKLMAREFNCPVVALSQLNRSLEQRPNKRPVMSDLRECVTGDTLVCLGDGRRVPIASLVQETPEVWSLDAGLKLHTAASDMVWKVGRKPVFRLHLASGRELRATAEHRLYGAKGWRTLSELAPGDRVALVRSLPEPRNPLRWPEHEIILLAHLIGDGSFIKHQPLRYTTASEENSLVVRTSAEAFGVRVNHHDGRGNWHQLVFSGNGNRWHPAGINRWLRNLGIFGQRSHEKQIPQDAFRLANDQIALLLRHLWATDGCIHVRRAGTRGAPRVYFSTCSQRLAQDVAALLLRLGIVARIRRTEQKSHRSLFSVDISGSSDQLRFLHSVGAFGPRAAAAETLRRLLQDTASNTNVDTLPLEVFEKVKATMKARGISHRAMAQMRGTSYGGSSHFGFSPSRQLIADYARLLDDEDLQEMSDSELYWDRVVAVVPEAEEDVYDLTVPGPANWLADGIVTHNSGAIEQDADVIMFVYRHEVYEPEKMETKGVAELIIGKQRNGPIGTVNLSFIGKHTRFENYMPMMTGGPGGGYRGGE